MIEAIVLAGGLGTRLREAVPDLPKCMAPVAGKPFLSHVIDALRMQGVERFIFSLGYMAEVIEKYLQEHYPTLSYTVALEEEPLGTGGAIQLAIQQAQTENILVANGDTLFRIQAKELFAVHEKNKAECTLALKPMLNFERYGVVEIENSNKIISFKEKQFYKEGLINGGIYLVNKTALLSRNLPTKFSFEKDYLEEFCSEGKFYAAIQEGYFIDIGIPEDYNKAQSDLKSIPLDLKKVDKSWTLFLDRDGVINDEIVGNYVLNWDGFKFSPGVLKALKILSEKVGTIVVISNQRGIGKGLMSEEDLADIHQKLLAEVKATGGRIDHFFYCTEKDNTCFNRKPNPGMALQAATQFPQIDLFKTIMVGNKPSDMRFGRAAGIYNVFITSTNPNEPFPHPDIDLRFNSLLDFALAL
ncbi:HAD-IIIA family hydrolase [Flavisolibacter tropicus]|uniref:Histidinol phosphate phosphatase n=1 Tax=Flavisolibacter tropicus TaxID=1492898 RepID=A0A172TQR2_9BACT|nr:HAD-IIIA family hydrolase [Flavisolibacter tropicus]ANE49370.1 histidinol phosphate phosphatase [Flavisolibacter tropicus]